MYAAMQHRQQIVRFAKDLGHPRDYNNNEAALDGRSQLTPRAAPPHNSVSYIRRFLPLNFNTVY